MSISPKFFTTQSPCLRPHPGTDPASAATHYVKPLKWPSIGVLIFTVGSFPLEGQNYVEGSEKQTTCKPIKWPAIGVLIFSVCF